jgi:putative tryptophan/tyrosine transport system substrate-binding protein
MRRRDFITILGGAAAAWPHSARAQQPAMPVVGFLHSASPEPIVKLVAAFRKGLFDEGFIEGQNVVIEFRWAAGQVGRLPELAEDLVRRKVAVIATPASTPAALAAKSATATIPIVFAIGGNPVALGLVASLNRPGGNVTGISFETTEIAGKALGLLRELVPHAARIVALVNPDSAFTPAVVRSLMSGAATLALQIEVFHASNDSEIEATFANIGQQPGTALLLGPDAFYLSRRAEIVALAARHALPTMYIVREYAEIGGLISYGPDLTNAYREAGTYTGHILKGEKPADLPVLQPVKFELVINLKTAKALGLSIPDKLIALADEVIE